MTTREFRPSGFFALRTPLLPLDDLLAWSEGLRAAGALDDPVRLESALEADRALLRERLSAFVGQSWFRDALFVASPDLEESLAVWIRDPESERGQRVERAIVRYFSRMAGRPTPFGLFAATSVGAVGKETRLVLEGRETYERHSRFDMDYLFGLAEALGADRALRGAFRYRPNSSLYRAAGRIHYVEARIDGKERTHHLVATEDSEELRDVLERSSGPEGASAAELAAALAGDDVSGQEAEEYVGELIESQILRPDLALPVTGPEPAEALARQLRGIPETASIGARLEDARSGLSAIDAGGLGADPARYRAIARRLEELPAAVTLARLFQVDLTKPSPSARLGDAVIEEITRAVEILSKLAQPGSDDLVRFREAFLARYEMREVPLVEALDEECGIGFPPSDGAAAAEGPLVKGINFPGGVPERIPWGARERFLLAKLLDANAKGAREIILKEKDLEPLSDKNAPPLPDAFAVMASIAAASEEALSRGDFRVFWVGSDGPSGARMLGRFCQADPALQRAVAEHLRAEEALDPDAIFAEVVHLPEGRIGNILARPVLREYEIPFLGCSGAPPDRQIPITDLMVSVSGSRIVLRSQRWNRRVIPRLTTAHNVHFRGLGLYRFLGQLQRQGRALSVGWDWTPFWSAAFLPRVVLGRLVLSPARWTVSGEDLKRLGSAHGAERFRAAQAWRIEKGLPRWFFLADGDNRLPVDLDNVLSVETFVHLVKDRPEASLVEMAPGPGELCASGPEGRFLHELIVPFVRTAPAALEHAADPRPGRPPESKPAETARTFAPGSEWIYAKVYASASNADRILEDVVGPLARRALESGAADRWFFIRYGDPQWHLRVRFHGDPARLLAEILPAIHQAAAPLLAEGGVKTLQLDTYEREIERYGGPDGILLAEEIFQADSDAVLEILGMLEEGDAGVDERWRLALAGIDRLLGDFGVTAEGRRTLLDASRRNFGKELAADAGVRRQIGDRFRKESRNLESLLDRERDGEGPLAPGLALLDSRSDRLAPIVEELRARDRAGRLSLPLAEIVPSVLHMHVNRMLRSGHREQEFVLYDFLARLYESRAARRTRAKPPLPGAITF